MKRTALRSLLVLGVLAVGLPARGDDPALRERARAALRKAVEFYRTNVSTQGGYHFAYAEDLSYGRSEMSDGPSKVEVQRDGTPLVGMAYLDAYEATRDGYYLEAAREVARALVRGQYCSGGWDYFIEFDSQKRGQYPYRADGRCSESPPARPDRRTTLDDNITQAAVRLLMRVDRDLEFKDAQIHEAALCALDSLIKAQYPNGAWPQRYSRFPDPSSFPVKPASYPESWSRTWPGSDYQSHYTFNDDSIIDMIDAMLEAARIYSEPRYLASAEKGGDFILLAQMPEPQPGWAQQYDRDMHPAWARRFEPPSITGGESQSVMKGLLLLFRETGKRKYLEPLPRALAYYRRSLLPDADSPSEIRHRACPTGTPCLARFAELKTNRPLYITKGTRVTALDQGTTTVDGYELSYSDASVITHYSVLVSGAALAGIEQEYRELQTAEPGSLKRPDRLHGLSPWSLRRSPAGSAPTVDRGAVANLELRIRAVIDAMDTRGAWVEEGSIGKANRLVSVFAAKEMVVTLAGKALPMRENDTLEVFAGAEPPKQRIIRTRTFAENIGALSAYLAPAQ
ncbi:MAG: polysaccharide lyase [Acidobacteria bacterium]|nr:polysaccharide lyase [Acidobacteriota bacterium]